MGYQVLIRSVIILICNFLIAALVLSVASANDEALDPGFAPVHELINTAELNLSIMPGRYIEQSDPDVLELPEPRSNLVSFARECAELEAVPLLDLSEQDDKKVFLGINFDGFLGIYARQ